MLNVLMAVCVRAGRYGNSVMAISVDRWQVAGGRPALPSLPPWLAAWFLVLGWIFGEKFWIRIF